LQDRKWFPKRPAFSGLQILEMHTVASQNSILKF
jgi:hypothetical protein